MHIIDIIVFLLFTGGVVAFGCSFFKKKGTSEVHFRHVCQQYQLSGISGKGLFGRLECICIQSFYSYRLLFCGSLLCAFLPESGQHIGL